MAHPLGWQDVYIVPTRDGSNTLFSHAFQATYHSIHGAVTESRHVFIQNGLQVITHSKPIQLLEYGFGTGLNAFLAFLFSQQTNRTINYWGIEQFPITFDVAKKLDYPAYLNAQAYESVFLEMHTTDHFQSGCFGFNRIPNVEAIPNDMYWDCIFLDAFAPNVHADPWSESFFHHVFARMAEGGVLATYCAQGEVRRKLQRAGFRVERLSGPPGKREMIRAIKPLDKTASDE